MFKENVSSQLQDICTHNLESSRGWDKPKWNREKKRNNKGKRKKTTAGFFFLSSGQCADWKDVTQWTGIARRCSEASPPESVSVQWQKKGICKREMVWFHKRTNPPHTVGFMQSSFLHFSLTRSCDRFLSLIVLRGESGTQLTAGGAASGKSKLPTQSKLWIWKWTSE